MYVLNLINAYWCLFLHPIISDQNDCLTISLCVILALSYISLVVAETFLRFACKQAATLFQE